MSQTAGLRSAHPPRRSPARRSPDSTVRRSRSSAPRMGAWSSSASLTPPTSMPMADFGGQPTPSLDLWADIQQLLQFHFMQNAFIAGTIVAALAGLIGYFMVLRGQSFAGHTLSQVGFPGAAGAALAGVTPAIGLLVFCVGSALGIAALSNGRGSERRAGTAAIGSILAFTLAVGFLFASLYCGVVEGVYAFLFGTFSGISDTQVAIVAAVAAVAVAVLICIGRPLFFASVDAEVAGAAGG